MNNPILKKLLPHIIAIAAFLLVAIIYFTPQLQGKVVPASDIMVYKGMSQEINSYREKTGDHPLWTNSMFGGMPVYQISSPQDSNITKYIEKIMSLGFSRPIGYFVYGMIAFYILLLVLRINPWVAIIAAIAFAFTTNNMVLFHAGHMTKVRTICASPLVIAGVILAYRSKYWQGGILFTIGMALSLFANHIQMTYYLGLCLFIYVIIKFIQAIKTTELKSFFLATGFLVLGLFLAVGTSASKMWTTYEYSKDTMRGDPILSTVNADPSSSSAVSGLAWDYAMSWSNGFLDLFSSYIPDVVGGSTREHLGANSAFAKAMKKKGANTRKGIDAPLYWGSLGSTSGPIYYGASIVLLFIMGMFTVKRGINIWLGLSALLLLLLSMGKNFEFLSRLFFDYAPMYNKFRTPNSILSVAAILFPLLGALSLNEILKRDDKKSLLKPLFISTGILAAISLFFVLVGPSMFDGEHGSDANYIQYGYDIEALRSDRLSIMRSSSLRSLGIILIIAAAIYFYLKDKLKQNYLLLVVAAVTFFDLMPINKRYVNNDSFVSARNYERNFQPRPVDTQILADKDIHYRVLDNTINTFNESSSSYFHKTIGGNHAAKLQRFEDIKVRHILQGNTNVLNMFNTKYYIVPGANNQATAQRNPAALGNAWFVNKIRMVEDANAEINALSAFDPLGEAIVHKEFENYIKANSYNKEGSIKLLTYAPDKLEYESNTTADQFAVFSEVWYGPDKGWKVTIDGIPVEHIRVNYILRGMNVPAGKHKITFVFDPDTFKVGETISLVSSILLLLLLLFSGWKTYKNYKG
jgi:hypothetical protein